jgi:ADP-L-glycero-D-manno-heptose 6-epimerase
VKDAVRMALAIASNPNAAGIFNLGSGAARTWLDLARAVFKALGSEPRIEFDDMTSSLRDEYQYRTEAKSARLRTAGFDGVLHSLDDGGADYVQRYLGGGSQARPRDN